jgi:PAS domain S-box-containing protein
MILVLGGSIVLQLTAAAMAFRLIRLTGKYRAWIFIAVALLLMAARRIISFYLFMNGDLSFQPEKLNEIIGLVLSFLLVIGIAKIAPVFSAIKQSEKAAKNSEEKYRSLLEHANDAIYLVDRQTMRILDCNKKATEMIGYSTQELQTMIFSELVPRLERTMLQNELAEIDSGKLNRAPLILHHIKKNGSFIIIEVNVSLIEIKGEQLILGIARDITERKHKDRKSVV